MQYAEDGQKTCQSMVKFSATLHTTEVNYKIPLFSLLWLVSDKGSEAPQGWIEWGNLLDLFLVTLHKLISSPTSLFPRLSLSLCPVYNHCKNTNQFGHSHEIYHRGCIYHHLYINSSVIQEIQTVTTACFLGRKRRNHWEVQERKRWVEGNSEEIAGNRSRRQNLRNVF